MPDIQKLECLKPPAVVSELHHLLWRPPHIGLNGQPDFGWQCRDHALILTCVINALGFNAALVYGAAAFVLGPSDGRNPTLIKLNEHAWVRLVTPDNRIHPNSNIDFSPNLKPGGPEWSSVTFDGVFLDQCMPAGTFVTTGKNHFENVVSQAALQDGGFFAIYSGRSIGILGRTQLLDAFNIVNSPLTDQLRGNFGPTLYLNAARHIHDLAKGRAEPLTHLEPTEAWQRISERSGDPVAWFTRRWPSVRK